MSVLVYDCGSVENTVTAILDTESGAMIIRGNGDVDNYMNEYSPWYSEHSNITQLTVDKGITRIGSGTFYGCENLSFVEIANTVTSIGTDVFKNCTSLSRIKIPKTITNISNGAFADSGLSEVRFYGNPPTVGTDIFDGVTADVYTPEGNEEWTETAKGTVAGNGSNLTWKTFDSKPNLIEYDELDYFWSRIKKYIQENKGGSSLPVIDDKTFIKYLAKVVSDSSHVNTNTTLYVSNPEYFSVNDCFYVKKDSTHFFYGVVSAVNNNTGALTYSIPASNGGTFFNPDDGQNVLNYGNPMNGGVYLDWANDRVDLYKNHTVSLERDYNIYDPILNINAWDSTTASIAEEDGVIDISGEDNHGQAYGGVSVVNDKVMGKCFYFDRSDSTDLGCLSFINHANLFYGMTKLSLTFTFKATSLEPVATYTYAVPFLIHSSTGAENTLFGSFAIWPDGHFTTRLSLHTTTNPPEFTGSIGTFETNKEYCLILTSDFTINKTVVYLNGVKIGECQSGIGTIENPITTFNFGSHFSSATYKNYRFKGLIKDFRIFDKALTSEEVQIIYKQSLVTPYINSNIYDPILNLDADYSTTASIAVADGVIDVSGNHNNGQAYGGVVVNNGAYEFDGTDDVIEFSNLLQGKESLTLSVNFTFPELPSGSARFFNSFSNKSGYKGLSLYLQPGGKIGYQLFNSSQNIEFYPDFIYQPNTNYNVMLVVDGISHKVQVYKNAEKISDESFSGSLEFHTTEILRVGGFTKTQDLYKGTMTNVKIFDRALTAEEVYNLYQQSLNPEAFENPEKLISYDEINVHNFDNNSLVQDTMFRIGNLSGILGITDNRQGVFIGDENEYIKFDKVNGLKINATVQNAVNSDKLNIKQYNGGSWQGILSVNQDTKDDTYNQILLSKEENNSNDIGYYIDPDATTGKQRVILKLGNSTDNSSLRGHSGEFWMFGSGTTYTRIIPNNTSNITLTLPNTTGTLALEKQGSVPIYYVQGPSTDTTAGTWTGSITGLTAYYDGLTILYVPAVAGASATTLNINNLGAKTCYFTNTSALTTHYSVGTPILFTYRDNAWRRADYNANTTYSAMSVAEGIAGTATNSRTMRADYLKQIIAALPSASCTGNAATATTATNTNNAKLTHTVGNAEYPLVFGSSFVITDAQQALRIGTPSATANQCPLRVKAYCAAANTQGEAYLVLGNALAKASANNARGGLVMYGTGTAYNFIKMNTVHTNGKTIFLNTANSADITLTLPSATGTIALTSSNITGSSASCTGNAATATTADNVTGTVAIAHGGTGATTRLNALKALTNEDVGANANYFLTVTSNWGKGGYTSVANAKTVLGIKNFVKSGSSASAGFVPSPGTTAGTSKFLCEDATWKIPTLDGEFVKIQDTTTSNVRFVLFKNRTTNFKIAFMVLKATALDSNRKPTFTFTEAFTYLCGIYSGSTGTYYTTTTNSSYIQGCQLYTSGNGSVALANQIKLSLTSIQYNDGLHAYGAFFFGF